MVLKCLAIMKLPERFFNFDRPTPIELLHKQLSLIKNTDAYDINALSFVSDCSK